jgi:hypothetical protein
MYLFCLSYDVKSPVYCSISADNITKYSYMKEIGNLISFRPIVFRGHKCLHYLLKWPAKGTALRRNATRLKIYQYFNTYLRSCHFATPGNWEKQLCDFLVYYVGRKCPSYYSSLQKKTIIIMPVRKITKYKFSDVLPSWKMYWYRPTLKTIWMLRR